jgi:rhodanese-related sulfurtransferase
MMEEPPLMSASRQAVSQFNAPVISVEVLERWLKTSDENADPLLIDTRTAEEFAVSHLPGAIHWDDTKSKVLPESIATAASEGRTVVFYCSIGYRSGRAADLAAEKLAALQTSADSTMQPLLLYNLEGGIFQWVEGDRPIEGGSTVHPYDKFWGRLLNEKYRHPL